jgi:hypothetical protein
MEETRDQQKLHGFLQCGIYVSIALEACVFIYKQAPFWGFFHEPLDKLSHLIIYRQPIYSKLATFLLICLVSVGTLAKKKVHLDPRKHIAYPLALGLLLFFGSILYLGRSPSFDIFYIVCSVLGALLSSIAMDNISKIIRSGLGKDKWNVEGESFMQQVKPVLTPIPSISRPCFILKARSVMAGSTWSTRSGAPS